MDRLSEKAAARINALSLPQIDDIKTPELIRDCYEMELSYSADREDAARTGFFLPGTTFTLYEDMAENAFLRAISDQQGVAAFIAILPPDHPTLQKMLAAEAMILFDTISPDPGACFWIAKIAVRPGQERKGFATALYKYAFAHFQGYSGMTATALSPIRNVPSENLHRSVGMRPCGVYLSGHKGALQHTVSTVWVSS